MGARAIAIFFAILLQSILCGKMMAASTNDSTITVPLLPDTIATLSDFTANSPSSDTIASKVDTLIAQSNTKKLQVVFAPTDTTQLAQLSDSLIRESEKNFERQQFVPNPDRALWLSLVFPGAGQIYNRKYWKLPIFYGGFMGCAYALSWNQQMYLDYSQAYLDIMDDDPNTKSYEEMLPPRYNIEGREEQFKKIFKRKKDYYRRYRDLSTFCFAGVYILSVIDAYVDAHLSEFDITPDLTMRVHPIFIDSNQGLKNGYSYGIGFSLNF